MKMSETRRSELYRAISDPIMELRLKYYRKHRVNADELDKELFELEQRVWRKVHDVLNLEGLT